MKDRIRAIMNQSGLSQQEFAARLQMTPASISGIFNGRTNPTMNHVMAIHRAFPQVNERWLLFGEGEMLSNTAPAPLPTSEEGTVQPTSSTPPSSMMIPEGLDDGSDLGGFFSLPPARTAYPPQSAAASPRPTASSTQPVAAIGGSRTQKDHANDIAKNFDKPLRRVKEIRVFYDDNTYETFIPAVK